MIEYRTRKNGTLEVKKFDCEVPSVVNGRTVTSIGSLAFVGSGSVKLPETVYIIKRGAFCNSAVTSVEGKNVSHVSEKAFAYCKNLVRVNLPALKTSELSVFEGCEELESANVGSVKEIEAFMFYACHNLKQIKSTRERMNVGISSFKGCRSLRTVPFTVIKAGDGAFEGCESLEMIKFADKQIENDTFKGCKSLKEFDFSKITDIGWWAFYGSGIKAITLGDNIKLGHGSFGYCKELTSFCLGRNDGNGRIIAGAITGCTNLKDISVDGFESVNGMLTKGGTIYSYPSAKGHIVITQNIGPRAFEGTEVESVCVAPPNGIIPSSAFRDCEMLIKAVINCRIIEEYAFEWSSLERVTINESSKIEDRAFRKCRNLVLPDFLEPRRFYLVDAI